MLLVGDGTKAREGRQRKAVWNAALCDLGGFQPFKTVHRLAGTTTIWRECRQSRSRSRSRSRAEAEQSGAKAGQKQKQSIGKSRGRVDQSKEGHTGQDRTGGNAADPVRAPVPLLRKGEARQPIF